MRVGWFLVGIYPRSEGLIKGFRALAKGRLSVEELRRRVLEEAERVVRLQSDLGAEYVIDGMLDWHDLLRPFAETWEGVELDGLARWFDNNTFYKKPILRSPSRRASIMGRYLHPEILVGMRSKLVLPDPYTFTALSEVKARFEDTLFSVAEALNEEAREIYSKLGLGQIQLSAPYLVWRRLGEDDLELAKQAVDRVFKGVGCERMIHLFFGDVLNVLPGILDFPVDVLGFDLTSTNIRELAEYSVDGGVALGLIDGRNSLMEREEPMLRKVESYLGRNEPRQLYITPSCDLEFLPPPVAEEKVRLISRITRRVREEIA